MDQFKLDTPNSPDADKDNKDDFDQPDFSGGPNFGSPDDWDQPDNGWFSKYGSTVVLPIIAILVLAGGIYLYATQRSTPAELEEASEELTGEEISLIDEEDLALTDGETTEEEATTEEDIEVVIPAPKKTAGEITETAISGDGITHLARRALKTYLSDNPQQGQGLSNEHKIYIEDYIKDNTGNHYLEVDDEISFSKALIQEAIDNSHNLTENQLNNLKVYSAKVAW